MPNLPDPTTWLPGDVILHRGGEVAVLTARWVTHDGWYVAGGGGLVDRAAREDWVRLTPEIGKAVWHLLYLGAVS